MTTPLFLEKQGLVTNHLFLCLMLVLKRAEKSADLLRGVCFIKIHDRIHFFKLHKNTWFNSLQNDLDATVIFDVCFI